MKKKETKNFVGVAIGNYVIKLYNAREVYGHDDSLPYNAEWQVCLGETKCCEGSIWNDGWGGESVLEYDDNIAKKLLLPNIESVCKETFAAKYKDMTIEYGFIDVLDTLAYIYIDCGKDNHGKVFSAKAINDFINK